MKQTQGKKMTVQWGEGSVIGHPASRRRNLAAAVTTATTMSKTRKGRLRKLSASQQVNSDEVISLPSTALTTYNQLEPNGRPTKWLNRETVHANFKTEVA